MTAATSPRSRAIWTALMSFDGQIATWSRIEPGTPADIGTSYGGLTPATAPSCQPWKWPVNFTIFDRPLYAPATRLARCGASVPDMGERTHPAHGVSPATSP